MKKISSILPQYAWFPVAGSFILNIAVFYGSRLVNSDMKHYNFAVAADRAIPFVPAAILIYILAFAS